MIGFTSGSTGEPQRFPKLWGGVAASTARNMAAIRSALGCDDSTPLSVLATVPPQHMYGMEWSVLLALIGGVAVHSGRPLFPADIAQALDELEPPRVLVATPVHLRAIVQSAQRLPQVHLVISATAPLDQPLAAAVERKLGGRLLEVFGSTETCAFASRRTADEATWRAYDGVALTPQPDGTVVNAPWFTGPVVLQDIVELQDEGRFVVRGRNTDMIEVAGKRGSLGDLTRRLLAIEGVQDAVVFQPDAGFGGDDSSRRCAGGGAAADVRDDPRATGVGRRSRVPAAPPRHRRFIAAQRSRQAAAREAVAGAAQEIAELQRTAKRRSSNSTGTRAGLQGSAKPRRSRKEIESNFGSLLAVLLVVFRAVPPAWRPPTPLKTLDLVVHNRGGGTDAA